MKILLVAHGFPPTHSAGAERRAARMAHWLAGHGHEVEVFAVEAASDPQFRVETGQQDGFSVHRLFYDIGPDTDDPLLRTYEHPAVGEAIYDLLRRQRFQMMHIISGYLIGHEAVRAARRAGVPVALTLTEFWFMCARLNLTQATQKLCSGPESYEKCTRCLLEDKRRYRLPALVAPAMADALWPALHNSGAATAMRAAVERRDRALRRTLELADLVICPSNFLIAKFAEFGFDTRRFIFLRQGLAKPARPAPTADRAAPPDGRLRLGYIGQIKPHKGVDLLLDAATALLEAGRPLTLDLWGSDAGSPQYSARLRAQSAPWEQVIRWNGGYTGAAVWDVLAGLDALVVPSRWYENSPNAILEAYEMGVPVVATDLGGMAELVLHETSGLLFGLNSAADLRRQLSRLLDEPHLLARLRAGIPAVKSLDQEMQEISAHYEAMQLQRQAG